MNCKVCGITSAKNTAVSFFRFPKDNTKCRDWAERCNLLSLYEKHGTLRFYKSFRICSDHFYSKDIIFDGRKKRLLQSAVPHVSTINNNLVDESVNRNKDFNDERILKLKLVENLCRLCSRESNNLTDIYGQKGKILNLENKLKYLPLMINKYDILPLKICIECISKVNQFHNFIFNCIRAERKLRVLLDLEVHEKGNKIKKLSTEPQGQTSQSLEGQKKSNSQSPTTPVLDLPNLISLSENVEDDYYDKMFQDDYLNKETVCFYKQPQPDYAMTNQLIHHTNFIKEVDFSGNINYEHDYSNKVTRDQLLFESEFQTDGDQNFMEEITYHCGICLESFCSIEVLNTHSLTHSVKSDFSREFTCEPCNKVFFNKFEYDQRTSTEGGGNYACKICDKKFHKVAFLKKHSILHQLESPFDSSLDLRPSEINLESNERKRDQSNSDNTLGINKEKPKLKKQNFKSQKKRCQFCDKLFKNRQICLDHEQSHTGDTPYQCKECEKTFRSRPSLRQHRSVHSDVRVHNCQECGMSFKRKDTLSNHMRIHTGERPFVCKICGFAFKQRGDCIKHEKNHQKISKTDGEEENLWGQREIRDVGIGNSSSEDLTVDVSSINEGTLWKEEKNLTLPPYVTITEENTLEDITGTISFNF